MQLRRERMHDDQIRREIATLENVLRYAIVRATKDANMSIHELDQSSIENMTLDRFVALYLIGPRRLVARLSDPRYIPNDEKHTRILRELCGKVSEQMGHSVMATAAAKRTEELISRHRQDIWSNGAAMVPGIQQEGVPSVSDGVSVYQPSILDGSWTAGENEEDIDSEIDESDQEYHNDQIHLESKEDDGEISDDNGEMFQLLQEREASETTKYTPGMLPASKFLTPSETSDSHSTYAPSSLSRFSKATKQREPTMVEDITLTNDDDYDERSTYTASSLSKHPNRERDNAPPVLDSSLHHHGQPRLISAEQMSRRDDEELTQYNPSEFSEFTMPRPLPLINTDANHLSFLPSIGEDEDDDDPIRSMASAGIEQTAQWVAGAIALTQDDQNIVQEGAATNALMVDNERLAQTLSVHRASEHGLTFVLTQAQKELGQTTAQLVEQREITDRLRQTLDEQNIKFRYEMDRLQNDLKTQEEIANQAQAALNELRERFAQQVAEEEDQTRVHRNSEEGLVFQLTQAHTELGQAHALLRERENTIDQLNRTLEEQRNDHERVSQQFQQQTVEEEDQTRVHRNSEERLVLQLTQAHTELGQVHALLRERENTINQLNQTLEERRNDHERASQQFQHVHTELGQAHTLLKDNQNTIHQLQHTVDEERHNHEQALQQFQQELLTQQEIATQARNAYETFKVTNTQHVEDIEAQARQTIEELTRELENRKSQIAELQNIRQELLNARQTTENELVAVRAQLEKNNQEAATLHDENKQLQTRVAQIIEDTNQKDGAIKELQTKVHTVVGNYELAREEAKRLTQEQRGYQDRIQILENNVHECTRLGETRIAELSKQNKDIQDAFDRSNKEKDVLSRIVESNKQSQQIADDQKDQQLLMTEEARQRLENDLQETRSEVIDRQNLIDEVLPVISRLRDVVETNQQQKQAITESDMPRVVEDVTTVIREQEKRLQNTFRELAHSIGVVDTNEIHDLVQKIQTDLKATREALVHLSREEDSNNQSDISRMPSSHLVRLAQERFAQMSERVKQTDHALDALKKITNSDRSDDVIKRMQEVMKEKNAIQDGLKRLTDTVVSSSSVDLIKIAQEKFRSLNQLYKEASSEVNSLRRRLDELQEQFEKQKTDYLRKKEDYLRQIQELSSIVTRVDSEKSQKADQNREFEITLDACKGNLTRAITECDLISDEKQKIEEKYARYQTECHERFLDLDAEIERLNGEIKQTKTRNEELERTNKDRESLRTEEKLEYETNRQILQDRIGECQNQLHLIEQKLDQKTKEYRQLLREHENAQIEWQKQVDSFNIQLDEAAPSRLTEIRLERDQLTRNASELEARLQHLQEIHEERDRLASLNEQLTRQLQELREARVVDGQTMEQLQRHITHLENELRTANPSMEYQDDTPQFEEDDLLGASETSRLSEIPSMQTSREMEKRLQDLGNLIADRELKLIQLDGDVHDHESHLLTLGERIEEAERILAELHDQSHGIQIDTHPGSWSEGDVSDVTTPPTSPLFEEVTLDQWKERFPMMKRTSRYDNTKRWVLAFQETEAVRCNFEKLDGLLDPRAKFYHREHLNDIVRQTIAFVVALRSETPINNKRLVNDLRPFDNLQRLAVRAKKYALDKTFRLATVCEFVILDIQHIPYEGAVLQRYCELIIEFAMSVTFSWRTSAMQQRQRLVVTECFLAVDDPTAVVVRFEDSPFQNFDRIELFKELASRLVETGRGVTIHVPVVIDRLPWTPRENLVMEFEGEIPAFVPLGWVDEYLNQVTNVVPELIHVSSDKIINDMHPEYTYLQIRVLSSVFADDFVLAVGQKNAWVIVDPSHLLEGNLMEDSRGCRIVGVLGLPQGKVRKEEHGFALMTWVREVFVYGKPLSEIKYRSDSDRRQCVFEHHFKCLFYPS